MYNRHQREVRKKKEKKQIPKMQNQLFQLILLGQFSFLICEVHQYIFIDVNKTWCDARAYCKANYTNLASVPNVKFMKKLQTTLKENNRNGAGAWIGLFSGTQQNKTWKWSQPGVESALEWAENDSYPDENCARMDNSSLRDVKCKKKHGFICYNERNQGEESYYVSEEEKSWHEAQIYCRMNHSDLACGTTQLHAARQQISFNTAFKYWIGLFKDNWRWIDNSSSSYRDWETFCEKTQNEKSCSKCAFSLPNKNSKWQATSCDAAKPFICYKDNVKLIKLEKEWDDAFSYCRQNHVDLVSIVTLEDQSWIQEKAREADTEYIWLGLQYSCPLDLWFWLNDMVSDESLFQEEKHCDTVVAMNKKGKYKLFKKSENLKYNFVCSVQV